MVPVGAYIVAIARARWLRVDVTWCGGAPVRTAPADSITLSVVLLLPYTHSSNTVSVHVDALGNWWEADVGSRYMQ
jgi:hypothetical protein